MNTYVGPVPHLADAAGCVNNAREKLLKATGSLTMAASKVDDVSALVQLTDEVIQALATVASAEAKIDAYAAICRASIAAALASTAKETE